LIHATAMLMHPDRQRFELIRARWEAAQQHEVEPANMVGRRIPQQPPTGEVHSNGGSKFRRTLNHGLAFISNPLSQRKTTPGLQPAQDLTRAVTGPAANASISQHNAFISPTRYSSLVERSNTDSTTTPEAPIKDASLDQNPELDSTPKALPRSRTASLLPRPVRSGSSASVSDTEKTIKLVSGVVISDSRLRTMPSKIPTPSPPLSERRVSSLRQYLHTSQQEKHVATGHMLSGNSASSPSKVAARSRTTSSSVKATNSPRPASYMTPTRAGYKKSGGSQHLALQENTPINKRVAQRCSQQQERPLRRESLAMPPSITSRMSLVQDNVLAHGKQANLGTPPTRRTRLNAHPSQQTPATARRGRANEHAVHGQGPEPVSSSDSIAQPRLMGPRNPATPKPLPTDTARPALPHSNTDKDLQRKMLGTPNDLGGIWRSSRALAAANHEVRRLPRSSTFHNFGRSWKIGPPIPPVPEQYRNQSFSNLFQSKPSYIRMPSNAASCEPIPEGDQGTGNQPKAPDTPLQTETTSRGLFDSSGDIVALPTMPPQAAMEPRPTGSQNSVIRDEIKRPWSISDKHYEDSADAEPWLQVRDYMPPLYWAGRFQSRYDRWRTDAMMAHLDPQAEPEGQLGRCTLKQEKLAACYVLAQLRDLCLTEQAADSLWV
jgi:hypothetical protein